jgi:hypothetical protein
MTVRRIGFVVLALAAAIITFALGPEPPEQVNVAGYDRQISQALSDYAANDALTQGAPQQQVVNGWIARDMLTVLAQQINELLEVSAPAASDDRIPLLLFVLILAVCWQAAAPPDLGPAGRSRFDDDPHDGVVVEPPGGAVSRSADQPERPVDDPSRVHDRRP